MQQLQANLYSVFLAEERDGPPNDADYLYDSDICMRELPCYDKEGKRNGRTYCESLKPDSLHVAQYLAYHRLQWFDGTKGRMAFSNKGRPRMCKCEDVVSDAEATRPRYKD